MRTAQRIALTATTLLCVLSSSGAYALDPHHSRNRRSIMWPFVHADRRCAGRGATYLGLTRR